MAEGKTDTQLFLVGTLIDGTGGEVPNDVAVVIEGGKIAQVGPRAAVPYDVIKSSRVVEARDSTAIPGLIDSHCHIFLVGDVTYKGAHVVLQVAKAIENAAALLQTGVTTVRDVGGPKDNLNIHFREAIKAGLASGPRVFTSGTYIMMTAGMSGVVVTGIQVDGADEARRAARRQLGAGADLLKVFATAGIGGNGHSKSGRLLLIPAHLRVPPATTGGIPGWTQMTVEEMRAVVEEAHKVNATVACHAIGTEGIKNALKAGVDTIEHGSGLDDEAIEMMAAQGVALVPTMSILHTIACHGEEWEYPPVSMENAKRHAENLVTAVSKAREAGIKIAAGTDSIDNDTIPMECAQLVKAGFTPMEAIVAATRVGAEILNKDDEIGTLEVGKRADLVILDGDPLQDIMALERAQYVVKDGKIVKGM